MKKTNYLELILITFIIIGISISFVNFFNFRSFWVDEVKLALNIINKPVTELFKPLDMGQVAPIGFLMIEKFFYFLFGNRDWVFRIFPLLCFLISIPVFYSLNRKLFKDKVFVLFATAFFSLSSTLISYSSEAKQYMPDVLFSLLILRYTIIFCSTNTKNQLFIYSFLGIASIWFSNVSIIILFTSGIYSIYKTRNKNRSFFEILSVISSWLISFAVYYLLFIHNHPLKEFMYKYWSEASAFLSLNIFSMRFYQILSHITESLVGLVGFGYFLRIVPWAFFPIGIFYLYKKNKEILYLCIFPVGVHLLLSLFKLYPFDTRLILYLTPLVIIIITNGMYHIISYTKSKSSRISIYLLIAPLLFSLYGLSITMPAQKEEIKDSLAYMNKKISQNENIYVFNSSSRPFSYYKNNYAKLINITNGEIIFGEYNRKQWDEHEKDILRIKGTTWLIFSHVKKEKREGINEEEYIVKLFEKNNFVVTDKHLFWGSSVYKLAPKKQKAIDNNY